MKFLKSKTGIIVIVAILVLALGIGAVLLFVKPDDSKKDKDNEPEREFEILEDGEEEVVSDDSLNVAEPGKEEETMGEGGAQFPTDLIPSTPGTDTPSTDTPGEDTPSTDIPSNPPAEIVDPTDGDTLY